MPNGGGVVYYEDDGIPTLPVADHGLSMDCPICEDTIDIEPDFVRQPHLECHRGHRFRPAGSYKPPRDVDGDGRNLQCPYCNSPVPLPEGGGLPGRCEQCMGWFVYPRRPEHEAGSTREYDERGPRRKNRDGIRSREGTPEARDHRGASRSSRPASDPPFESSFSTADDRPPAPSRTPRTDSGSEERGVPLISKQDVATAITWMAKMGWKGLRELMAPDRGYRPAPRRRPQVEDPWEDDPPPEERPGLARGSPPPYVGPPDRPVTTLRAEDLAPPPSVLHDLSEGSWTGQPGVAGAGLSQHGDVTGGGYDASNPAGMAEGASKVHAAVGSSSPGMAGIGGLESLVGPAWNDLQSGAHGHLAAYESLAFDDPLGGAVMSGRGDPSGPGLAGDGQAAGQGDLGVGWSQEGFADGEAGEGGDTDGDAGAGGTDAGVGGEGSGGGGGGGGGGDGGGI